MSRTLNIHFDSEVDNNFIKDALEKAACDYFKERFAELDASTNLRGKYDEYASKPEEIIRNTLTKLIKETYLNKRYEDIKSDFGYCVGTKEKEPLIEEFIRKLTNEVTNSEEFLDNIVARIKRKQV
jgi:hypothetical protein